MPGLEVLAVVAAQTLDEAGLERLLGQHPSPEDVGETCEVRGTEQGSAVVAVLAQQLVHGVRGGGRHEVGRHLGDQPAGEHGRDRSGIDRGGADGIGDEGAGDELSAEVGHAPKGIRA